MLVCIAPKSPTTPLRIEVSIPNGPKGYFIGHAKHKTEAQKNELVEQRLSTEEGLREMFEGFDGLGNEAKEPLKGEEAWNEVLTGVWSSHFTQAAMTKWYLQFSDSTVKNSRR